MESFGEILHNARVEKNLDIEKIAREISIEKKYLQGLEDEDNSVFPGEAYMIGFLRNYSNYLELDTEFILKLYNNKKIQESPVPEGLLVRRRPRWLIPAIIIPVFLIVAAVTTITILLLTKKNTENESQVVVLNKPKYAQYTLDNTKFTKRVYKGDQFIVPTDDGGQIIITVRDTLSSFGLDTPAGIFYTDLAEESEIDINGDSKADIIVYVSDISYTDESRGVEVSILLRYGTQVQEQTYMAEIPFITDIKSKHPQKVIIEDNRAYPFTLNASFRGPCLFRDKVDNSEAVETYFTRGEVFTANPHNGIRLWISNSNTVKFTIIADQKTFELDIGIAGQVLVEDIKWIKDTDGKYKLVVIELD